MFCCEVKPEYSNPASFESTSPSNDPDNDYQNNIVARRMMELNITSDGNRKLNITCDEKEHLPDKYHFLLKSIFFFENKMSF